jgi:hypothetical protein
MEDVKFLVFERNIYMNFCVLHQVYCNNFTHLSKRLFPVRLILYPVLD